MENIRLSKYHAAVLLCMLFSPSIAVATDALNAEEVISQDQKMLYICFDKDMSNIANVIAELAALDATEDSPLRLLQQYLKQGYQLGIQEEVLGVLEYADWFVTQLPESEATRAIAQKLDDVIEQAVSGALTFDDEAVMNAPHLRLVTIDNSITVRGKAIFKNIVVMDKKLRVHGRARFYDNVHFKDNVKIDDTLSANDAVINNASITTISVADQIIGCDVTVGCNINMTDSTDAAHGNIVKDGTVFMHNFGVNQFNPITNTFVGQSAGNFTMSGGIGFNIGIGAFALTENTTGDSNSGVGTFALNANTSGIDNTGVGSSALANNNIGSSNTAVGNDALLSLVGGDRNTAIGSEAMGTTGFFSSGSDNTAVGAGALQFIDTGSSNVAIGSGVASSTSTGSNNIYIDGSGFLNPADESDTIRIGSTQQTRAFIAGIRGVTTDVNDAIAVVIDSAGQLGTLSSSAKFKDEIRNMCDESAAIFKLNPVSFVYKTDASRTRQFGLIAEEVDQVFPRLVIRDKDGQPFTVRYEVLPVLLLNEMKKLVDTTVTKEEMQKVTNEMAVLIKRITMLEKALSQVN